MKLLYTILIRLYGVSIRLISPFYKKARHWVNGRRYWRHELAKRLAQPAEKTMWMHAASLGEFEQGRPVLEAYRKENPYHRIVLTFFSPSGFEVRKDYDQADLVCYLPLDTSENARDFIELVSPDIVVFVKYEFWFNHLMELKKRKVPTYLVSGRMYSKQLFFKSWGGFFRKGLSAFEHFFLQDEQSAALLKSIGYDNVKVTGDTRFDRVLEIVQHAEPIDKVRTFVGDKVVLILGSSWPYEEIVTQKYIQEHQTTDYKVIIAPHEIDLKRISEMENTLYCDCCRLSTFSETDREAKVMFVDSIGKLSSIYRYADVAFVGGGYGDGIHNILEPSAWSKPVLFGPRYFMFKEAVDLIERGGAITIEEQHEVNSALDDLLGDVVKRKKMGQVCLSYCHENAGATQKVMKLLQVKESV